MGSFQHRNVSQATTVTLIALGIEWVGIGLHLCHTIDEMEAFEVTCFQTVFTVV